MRISDWSSDVCSSDLEAESPGKAHQGARTARRCVGLNAPAKCDAAHIARAKHGLACGHDARDRFCPRTERPDRRSGDRRGPSRAGKSEEHTSELQSLMRISYAVFCSKKKKLHCIAP